MNNNSGQGYLQDGELAILLTRLAALHGRAVPAHRFGMVEKTLSGLSLASLPRHLRARELWSMQFESGQTREIPTEKLARDQFPLLWVSRSTDAILLLRGQLGNGRCSAENAQGELFEVDLQQISQGHLLQLVPTSPGSQPRGPAPKTAGDWFVYAVRRYRAVFLDAILATLVISVVGLVGALYSMQVYDRVIPSKGYSTLLVLTVGALLAVLIELILKQVRSHMIERACKAIDQDLSSVFFGKALHIRLDARPQTVGTFASQIRQFETVRNFLTSSTLFVLADGLFAIALVGVIAMISFQVALIPLALIPVSFLLGWLLRKPIEALTAQNMEESNRKNGLLIEAIDGIESIKAANAEWKVLDRWRHLTWLIGQGELSLKALANLSSHVSQSLQQVVYIGMVLVGAYAITDGNLTMGGLIACTIISGRAIGPLVQIPGLIVQWKHAEIALKGLNAIMALPNDREEDARLVVPEGCKGLLRAENTKFAYGQGLLSIQVPDLIIRPGERVAILGSVGSGKSTLLKLLAALYRPQQGVVSIDGVDATQLAPEFVREHIGYMPQDVRLYQGTLRDNLTLGLPSPTDSQLLHAAERTGLEGVLKSHPRGLALEISEGGRGLSGGQRQLVGLTRLLLQQPQIMLLDEPTASMDGQLETRVMQHLFQEIKQTSTLVVVTHKLAVLNHVQRVIVMDQGRIVMDGPRDSVLARLAAHAAVSPTVASAVKSPTSANAGGQA